MVDICRRPWLSAKAYHVAASQPAKATRFADGHVVWPSAKVLCRGPSETLGKERFFFIFFFLVFSGAFLHQIQPNFKSWDNFEFFFYISLIIFVSLNFFGNSKFELQVHEIMEFFDSKNGIHNVRSTLRPYPGPRMKLRPCWCRNMASYVREKCFKII